MRKLKVDKFKFYLKILSIILIINLIIGYFPRNLAIADTVIGSNTDTINDVYMADIDISNAVDAIDTRKASDTNADYLGKVKFYDYYGSNQLGTTGTENDRKNYYFEKFNTAISNYSKENNIMYPLYFGDFNASAGESNAPEEDPERGQTLKGSAYKFFWAVNRASRSENKDTSIENSKYTASVQGLVSDTLQYDELTKESKLTQDIRTINFADPGTQSKNFNISSVTVKDNAKYEDLKGTDIFKRRNVGKITYPGATGSKQDFRVEFKTGEGNFSGYDKYLTFDVYNENKDNNNYAGGSLFVAIKDSHGNQMAGWTKYYGTEYYDNTIERGKWQTIVVDLEELKQNNNNKDHGTNNPKSVDFSKITSVFIGYWQPAYIFIDKDSFKFLGNIVEEKTGTVELPYFNSEFLNNSRVGTTTQEYEFPFKIRSKSVMDVTGSKKVDTDYYIFSSGKSGYQNDNDTLTDVVRITNEGLKYWFNQDVYHSNEIVKDMVAVWGGAEENEPGFFPFNSKDDSSNVDKLNYGFGARIEIQFRLTQDGTMTTDEGVKLPLEFNFKGDDDVWVYIDNQLALDMGGGHSQTEGNINFVTGIATVKNVVDGKITSNSLSQPVVTKTKELKLPNDYYIDCDPSKGYDTDKIHTLTLFYMERGMIESNLYMDFNFIPSENELIVEKEVDTTEVNNILASETQEIAKDIQFKFAVFENDNAKAETEYVYSENSPNPKTDKDGAFFLKDEETATFLNKFAELSKVYITEEQDDRFTTSWRWYKTANNFQGDTSGKGYSTSEVTIPSSQELFEKYTYHAIFTNKIKTDTLRISKYIKLLEGETIEDYENDIFDFKVTFTEILGTKLDQPIEYTLQLKAGQTTEITGIPVGTKYEIVELLEEELGNKYEIESITGGEVKGNTVKGEITVDDTEIEITYVNKKKLRDIQLIKVDSSDSNIKLEGAKFRLNKLEENGDIDKDFDPIEVSSDKNGQASFVDLPYGKYMITEVQAPEGYELLKEPIKFKIDNQNNNSVITIEVKNNKSIKLPAAGGNGNITSKYIGFMLIGLAGILYSFVIIRNKKYKFN